MGVVFESVIKFNDDKEWFIELKDTIDGKVAICKDLKEYAKNVEEFGSEYGGNIDEINWSKDENVPPFILDEIRLGMAQYQEEVAEFDAKKQEQLEQEQQQNQ